MHRIDEAEKSHFQCIYYSIFFVVRSVLLRMPPFSVFHNFYNFSLNVSFFFISFIFRVRVIVERETDYNHFFLLLLARDSILWLLFSERCDLTSFACSMWYSVVCSSADEIVSLSHFYSSTPASNKVHFFPPSHTSHSVVRPSFYVCRTLHSADTLFFRCHLDGWCQVIAVISLNSAIIHLLSMETALLWPLLPTCSILLAILRDHVRDLEWWNRCDFFIVNMNRKWGFEWVGSNGFLAKNVHSRFN